MGLLPKISTLVGVAGGCGIGVGIMMLLVNKERDRLVNTKSNFITRAVGIMKQEPQVKQLLGENIEVGKATLTDGWSKMQSDKVRVRVPIKGEHDNAYLFAYARRRDEKEKLKLYKIEATFEKIANKKLVILDRTDKEDLVELEEEEKPKAEPLATSGDKPLEEKQHPKLTKEDYKQQMKSWAVPK